MIWLRYSFILSLFSLSLWASPTPGQKPEGEPKPEPIPLDCKVALVSEGRIYPHVRSYADVVNRIEKYAMPALRTREIYGEVEHGGKTYPLYALTFGGRNGRRSSTGRIKNILVVAGTYGNEPASVESALLFLENHAAAFTNDFHFHVLPCLNPSGYESNKASTLTRKDVGKSFYKNSEAPEAQLAMAQIDKWNLFFDLVIELRELPGQWGGESWETENIPTIAEFYENHLDKPDRIANQVVTARPGISRARVVPFPLVLPAWEIPPHSLERQLTSGDFVHRHTDHYFSLSTPTAWPLESRTGMHTDWLKKILELSRHSI